MNRFRLYQIDRKTEGLFRKEELPSVHALVDAYRRFQRNEYSRNLSFSKALDEFIECVFLPVCAEIRKEGTDDFYSAFMNKSFSVIKRDTNLEKGLKAALA